MVLEKTLESPLDCKEIQPVHSEGDQPWNLFGRNDFKAQHSENEDHGIGPTTSWEIDGETVETVSDFIFLGSKITTDGDCSHQIKRHLLLGRKVMTNLDSIFKSRDIASKGPSSQGYGFSCGHVWM